MATSSATRAAARAGEATVEARGLARSFEAVRAVRPLDFTVEAGEIFGILGPDGAGKTTLFRMLVSLLRPDAGTARVDGLDVVADYRELRRRVGYMPGRFSLYQDLSVAENQRYIASIFGLTVEENRSLFDDLYRLLEPVADRRADALSGGRVDLGQQGGAVDHAASRIARQSFSSVIGMSMW